MLAVEIVTMLIDDAREQCQLPAKLLRDCVQFPGTVSCLPSAAMAAAVISALS